MEDDEIKLFVDDCMIRSEASETSINEIYARYHEWVNSNGDQQFTNGKFLIRSFIGETGRAMVIRPSLIPPKMSKSEMVYRFKEILGAKTIKRNLIGWKIKEEDSDEN